MSASPYARAAGRGCAGSLLQLALVPVALAVVFGVPLGLAALLPVAPEAKILVAAGGVIAMLIAFVALALGFATLRTRVLDPGFASLGIAGRSWIPNLREYHGAVAGRRLDALYARRGGVLDVALDARTATKLSIGRGAVPRAARELIGLATFPAPPDAPDWVIAAADPAWAERLLRDPEARGALATLLDDPTGREVRWALIRPSAVKITRRWIDPDAAGGTIDAHVRALEVLARACERLPAPATAIAPGRFEESARRAPTRIALVIVAALLGLLIVPAIGLGVALFLTEGGSRHVPVDPEPAPAPEGSPRHPHRHRRH